MPAPQFCLKLSHWKHDGINVSAQARLCVSEHADYFPETSFPDHRQVNVALRAFRPLRQGSKHEGDDHPVSERVEALSKHICKARCFFENRSKFLEDWARTTRREKHVSSTRASFQETRIGKRGELSLEGALAHSCVALQLTQVEGLTGMAEKPSEQTQPRASE